MKVSKSIALVVVMTQSFTGADTLSEYTSMSKKEQLLFSKVAEHCSDEVYRTCKNPREPFAFPGAQHFAPRRETEEHGSFETDNAVPSTALETSFYLNGIPVFMDHPVVTTRIVSSTETNPSLSLEEFNHQVFNDFDSFFENLIRPRLSDVVFFSEEPCSNKFRIQQDSEVHAQDESNFDASIHSGILNDLMRSIAERVPVDQLNTVVDRLQEHGNTLMTADSLGMTQSERRMARRLQALSADEMISFKQSFLPFSRAENDCLEHAYQENRIMQPDCYDHINELKQYRFEQFEHKLDEHHNELIMYNHIAILYIFGFFTLFLYALRKRRQVKRDIRLQERILTAIYSTPDLKRQVELKIGESTGFVPPLPPHVLARRGLLGAEFRKRLSAMRNLSALLFLVFVALVMIEPFAVVKIFSFIAIFHCLYVSFIGVKAKEPVCICCCCAMSTEDLRNGVAPSPEQMCCNCCQGTGICSVQCASCCGPTTDNSSAKKQSHCCVMSNDKSTDICCCERDNKKAEPVGKSDCDIVAKKQVYQGASIQIV